MISFEVNVTDPEGLHARPAGIIAKAASKYKCCISLKVYEQEKTVDAKRLFKIMSLAVKCGQKIAFDFDGEDEMSAYDEFIKICKDNALGDVICQ